ncbi:hypothetical protein M2352_001807 [Azospirillum fermentarium]|uniref:hypothetical protein n=1 Tax=Azospirillum fermentarium TaxID=1233114 RepID=UPI0022270073|nr:hypothetical protein [Azospirillum fermentarium]MCW2246216.1 hypothetical protein [Azospirillum fermentarium]
MRAASDFFRQSDPAENRQFRRLWAEPAHALRLPAPAPAARTLDQLAAEITLVWRAEAGRA